MGMTLLMMSISGGIFILVVCLLRLLMGKQLSALVMVALWTVVVLRLLLPVSIPAPTSAYNVVWQAWSSYHELAQNERGGGNILFPPGKVDLEALSRRDQWLTAEELESLVSGIEIMESRSEPVASAGGVSGNGLVVIWAVGPVAMATVIFGSHWRFRRRYGDMLPVIQPEIRQWSEALHNRAGRWQRIRVWQHERLDSPVTYGLINPVVLLPKHLLNQGWQGLEPVLAHELNHIKHWDVAKKWLLATTLCIHWFNPLVWLMYRQAGKDLEILCDERTLRGLGAERKTEYAQALLLMEAKRAGVFLHSGFTENGTKERVARLASSAGLKKRGTAVSLAVSLALILGAIFATSASRPEVPVPAAVGYGSTVGYLLPEQMVEEIENNPYPFTEMEARGIEYDFWQTITVPPITSEYRREVAEGHFPGRADVSDVLSVNLPQAYEAAGIGYLLDTFAGEYGVMLASGYEPDTKRYFVDFLFQGADGRIEEVEVRGQIYNGLQLRLKVEHYEEAGFLWQINGYRFLYDPS